MSTQFNLKPEKFKFDFVTKKVYTMIELGNFQCSLCGQEITNVESINEIFIHYNQGHRDYKLSIQQCVGNMTEICQKDLLSNEAIL